jgi:exodeoxyribonuclease VII large subunit
MPSLFDLPFEEPPPTPAEANPPKRRVYSVAELTAAIRALLEETWFEVWVEGELSNCKIWNTTGHLYFTLKDDRAQIRGFMHRNDVRLLKFRPEDGLTVIARGRLTVYDPKGEYQLTCATFEPKGLGALQVAFDQLKRKLQGEGLFDASRKRPLPLLPRKIGIVTSLDGAAIRDIVKVLRRRYENAHLVIRPARVQGEGAAEDIARGIAQVARHAGVDVVIVGRGGGSVEDLWAFNEEVVARAIAAAKVPVISAVGHETDVTIADFVADHRAATPSNAAELVVARKDEFVGSIDRSAERIRACLLQLLHRRRSQLHAATSRPGLAGFGSRLSLRGRRVDEMGRDLVAAARTFVSADARRVQDLRRRLEARDPQRRLATDRARLERCTDRLSRAARDRVHGADREVRGLAGRLDALSPLAVLARGYAVCWNAERSAVIREASPDLVGHEVCVTLARGELRCAVTETRPAQPAGEPDAHGRHDPDV